MYWWNIKALRDDLRADLASEREKMRYFLAHFVLIGIGGIIPSTAELRDTVLVVILNIVALMIIIGGVLSCYEANHLGDGKRFVERFVCISWPIGVRLVVYTLFLAIILLLALPESAILSIFEVIFPLCYFFWIRSEFLKISGAEWFESPRTAY